MAEQYDVTEGQCLEDCTIIIADQYDVTEGQCPEDCPDVEVATYCINDTQQVQNISRVNVHCQEDSTSCGDCEVLPNFDLPKTFCVADTQPAQNVMRVNVNKDDATTINVTHEDLLSLINNNELIPNSSYRITDYSTTTAQTNTQSAGHDFDIVVTALSTNKLSEIASCVRKEGDTYFTNAKLESWEIKYCINNDVNRFAWADNVNGKGVIYYMKDEWGNECPYDFKNIQFNKSSVYVYTFGGATDDSLTGGCHHNTMIDYISSSVLILNFNTFGTGCYSNTFNNDCHSNTFGNDCYSNTFSIKCDSNKFGDGCYYNTFGNGFDDNTFGNNCYSNTFGDKCDTNTFGDSCYYNTFGNGCDSNTFGIGCYSNIFGDSCNHNILGGSCSQNTFGDNCDYNTFDTSCSQNIFGDNCIGNKFGIMYQSNTFGNRCSYNNFYAGLSGTAKKDYIRYIVLEDGCSRNNFYSSASTSYSNYLQRIRIKGLENTTATDTQIMLSELNTKYEWLICYTSSGVLKQYCPSEETNNLLPLIYAGL